MILNGYLENNLELLGKLMIASHDSLRDDYEVVLSAVTNKGLIFKYASKRLRETTEIAVAAMKQDKRAYDFMSKEMQQSEAIQELKNS